MIKHIIISVFAVCTLLFTGCDKINSILDNTDSITYAKYAGKAVAVVVNASDKYFSDANVKIVFTNALTSVIAALPKTGSYTNISQLANSIVLEKVQMAVTDKTKQQAYITILNSVFALIDNSMDLVVKKYSAEFEKAETAYSIVYAFLDSTKTAFDAGVLAATKVDDKTYQELYDQILKLSTATNTVVAK